MMIARGFRPGSIAQPGSGGHWTVRELASGLPEESLRPPALLGTRLQPVPGRGGAGRRGRQPSPCRDPCPVHVYRTKHRPCQVRTVEKTPTSVSAGARGRAKWNVFRQRSAADVEPEVAD